jgi:hypothetical protein
MANRGRGTTRVSSQPRLNGTRLSAAKRVLGGANLGSRRRDHQIALTSLAPLELPTSVPLSMAARKASRAHTFCVSPSSAICAIIGMSSGLS